MFIENYQDDIKRKTLVDLDSKMDLAELNHKKGQLMSDEETWVDDN